MLPLFNRPASRSKESKASEIAGKLGVSGSVLIRREDITLGERIGKGGFGTVFRAVVKNHRAEEARACVAKQIAVKHVKNSDLPLLRTELQVWSELDHPNCLKFFGVSLEPAEYLMICEYMDGGTLADVHERNRAAKLRPPTLPELVARLKMIASAMEYLHSRSIIHRDLKSPNILLEKGSERIVIADFGLARYCVGGSEREMTAETGSYRWMAPEVMRHEPYHKPCDVYSFGLVAWEMLTYKLPFNEQRELEAAFAVALRAERPPIPPQCAESISALIQACWTQAAEERPSFEQVLGSLKRAEVPEPEPATSAMPRVSSKRKICDAPGACSPKIPPLKRPDSISSGLTSLLNVHDKGTSSSAIHAS